MRTESSPSSMLETKQLNIILNKEKNKHFEKYQQQQLNEGSSTPQTQILDLKKFLNQKKYQSMQMPIDSQNANIIQGTGNNNQTLQNNISLLDKNQGNLKKKASITEETQQQTVKKIIQNKSGIKVSNSNESNQNKIENQLSLQPVSQSQISMFQEAAADSINLNNEKQKQNLSKNVENKILAEISNKINSQQNQPQVQQASQQFQKKEKTQKDQLEQIISGFAQDKSNKQQDFQQPYNLQISTQQQTQSQLQLKKSRSTKNQCFNQQQNQSSNLIANSQFINTNNPNTQKQQFFSNFKKIGRGAGFYNLHNQQFNTQQTQAKEDLIIKNTNISNTIPATNSSINNSIQEEEVESFINLNKQQNGNIQCMNIKQQQYSIPSSFSSNDTLIQQKQQKFSIQNISSNNKNNNINNNDSSSNAIEISFSQNQDIQYFDKNQLEDFLGKLQIVLQNNAELSQKLEQKKLQIKDFYKKQNREVNQLFDALKDEIENQKTQFKDISNFQQQEVMMSFDNYDYKLKQANKIMKNMLQDIMIRKEEIISNLDLYPKRFNLFLKQYQKKLIEQNQLQENILNQQIILKKIALASDTIFSQISLINNKSQIQQRKSRSVSNTASAQKQQKQTQETTEISQNICNDLTKSTDEKQNLMHEISTSNLIESFKKLFSQVFVIKNKKTDYTSSQYKDLSEKDYFETTKQNFMVNPILNQTQQNQDLNSKIEIQSKFNMPRTCSEQQILTKIDFTDQYGFQINENCQNGFIQDNYLKKNPQYMQNIQISFDNIDLFLNSQKKLQQSLNNTSQNSNNISQVEAKQPLQQPNSFNPLQIDNDLINQHQVYYQQEILNKQQIEAITPKQQIKQREQRECHSLPPTKISDFSFLNSKDQTQIGLGSLDTFFNNNMTTQKSNQKYLNLLEKISSNQVNTQNFYSCFIKSNKGFLSPDNARIQQVQSPTTMQEQTQFTKKNCIIPNQLYTPQNYPNLKVNTTTNLMNHQKDMAQFYNILEQKLNLKQQQQTIKTEDNNNEIVNISSPEYYKQQENQQQVIGKESKFKINNSSYQKTLFCSPHFKESNVIIEHSEKKEDENY